MSRRCLMLVFAAVLALAGGVAFRTLADVPPTASPSELSPEQKTAALDFAREHHSQLASLIRRLEKRDPVEFEKALADLSKAQERLSRLQPRDPERYEVDLNVWKVDSRIRLLAARMANEPSPPMEKQLRELIDQRTDLRLQQLALERTRLAVRLERIDGQISQLSADRDSLVDKEVERLHKSVRRQTSEVSQPASAPRSGHTDKAKPAEPRTTPATKPRNNSGA